MGTAVQEQVAQQEPVRKSYSRRLIYYHPNSKGAGSAAQFELRLNRPGEKNYDCVFLEMAHQKPPGGEVGQGKGPAAFDWAHKVTVKLDFTDLCAFLLVLEGRREQMGNGSNGIYHEAAGASTLISLKKSAEHEGYFLGVSKKTREGTQVFKGHILLNEGEALGLRCVFQSALFAIALSTPSGG